jgi:outer membrane autotransporter protein
MSRFSVKLLLALASSTMLAAAPAAAQKIQRIVAFGDSYADDGNLFELLGIPRPAVYANGRFSNGTNFIDTMAQLLAVPVDNFAIGGAFTNNGNINGPGIPGFVTEYQSFLAGGGPAAFPRVNGRFAPTDLLAISIGGNDARAYERSLGLNPTSAQIAGLLAGAPTRAAVSVAEATTGLNALVGAGARNITFLVGDVGRLPEVRGLPVAAVGTAYASSFNSGIQASLANIASGGVIVNYLDLTQIGNVVEANLPAFGLISAGACPVACVTTDPSLLDKYLFYVDQVHLTSAGFAIVGRYAVRQLEAPLTFGAQTDLGLSAVSNFGQLMSGRLDLAGGGGEGNPLSFYLVATSASHDLRDSSTSLAYDYDSFGAAGGAEYDFGAGLVGIALSYAKPKSDSISGTSQVRADAYHIGAYGKFEAGGAFAEAYAGIGRLDYELRREAVIDTISAETDGTTLVAGGEAGYLLDLGGFKAGPVVGVQYARVKMDDYSEAGDPVLTLNVSDQRASELVGFAGLETEFETEVGGLSISPFVNILAEKQLDSSGGTIRYANTASPIIVNRFELEEGEDDVYARLEGGASLELASGLALQLQASATVEHPEQDEFSGSVGLKLSF